MNKKEFVDYTSEMTGVARYKLSESIDAMTVSIPAALQEGESIQINGFGSFTAREHAPRKGRLNGQEIQIPAKIKFLFKPSAAMVEAVKENQAVWKKKLGVKKK